MTVAIAVGCRSSSPSAGLATSSAPSASSQTVIYPPGPWRLRPDELPRVLLSIDHILIAHADSRVEPSSSLERSELPVGHRTRDEARDLSSRVAKELRANAALFADYAARYSDDRATAKTGGALGLVQASELPAAFLDALATMPPESVSQSIETRLGFHVLRRNTVPPDEDLHIAELVIAHRAADPAFLRLGLTASRTDREAEMQARELVSQLRSDPAKFASLARSHSDHASGLRDGDIGVWRLYEPEGRSRELDLVRKLRVGEISDPLDTLYGFKVLKRLPVDDVYAAAVIAIPISHDQQLGRREALALAEQLLNGLRRNDLKIDDLHERYCCRDPWQWRAGHGDTYLETTVQEAEIGKLVEKPIEIRDSVLIVRRVAPSSGRRSPPLFDLPRPSSPSIEHLVSFVPKPVLVKFLAAFTSDMADALQLQPDERDRLTRAHREFAKRVDSAHGDAELHDVLIATRSEVQALLGNERFARYQHALQTRVTRDLLATRPPEPTRSD